MSLFKLRGYEALSKLSSYASNNKKNVVIDTKEFYKLIKCIECDLDLMKDVEDNSVFMLSQDDIIMIRSKSSLLLEKMKEIE